jgi:flagellar hook-associated protein 2
VNAILNSATNTSGSGIDVTSTVDAILEIDAAPEEALQQQVTSLNTQTSALQSLQSDITAFQSSIEALTDYTGDFSALSVSSSNNDVVSATAANGTATGTHTVTVTNLATTSSDYSTSFSSATAALPTGQFTLQVGTNAAVTIPVDSADSTDTLNGLATYINNQNPGVKASVITDSSGSRLALVSQTSGLAGEIILSNDTTGTKGNGMGFTDAVNGKDASLTVDGIPVDSASNTVTGVIPGVTLTLSGQSSSPVTIGITPDLTSLATDINNFITSWNTLIQAVNSGTQYNSSTGTTGTLTGDTSVDFVQQQLLSSIASSMSGNNGVVNLQSIGIEMQDDGTLSVDSTTLNNALENNFSAVQNLFQSTSGVGQTLQTSLDSLTDPITGALNVDMNGISSEITDLNSQISDFQAQLRNTQAQLTAEYSTINTTLEQLPETLAEINDQLNALNPSNTTT